LNILDFEGSPKASGSTWVKCLLEHCKSITDLNINGMTLEADDVRVLLLGYGTSLNRFIASDFTRVFEITKYCSTIIPTLFSIDLCSEF